MMIALPGFEIVTLLKAGVKAVIYRGIKVKDQCPVIIKGLRPEECTPNNIEQLKHEYAIAQRLNIAAAPIAYALEIHQGIPYLIMEDFGGRSLDHLLDQFQQPVPFVKIAIEITSKLAQIHTHHIVHKDIKPQNILVNLETNQVKIADFGIAALIPYQQQIVSSSSRIEGSLPYLSPEQTGRMNRGIDHRSDLYSLGVTFYEMLTGQLPFKGKDPLEWVHCHIAKSPLSLTKLNSDIPQMLCEIIMKLLSKLAEHRYQSALGLQFDLERCLKQLQTTGQIQSFVLGEQDISDRFQIPQKLYGREQEIAKLLQAFERVVSQGKPEIVFVSGYAGVGKSSIVKEIHKPIVRERGAFICGKFDQYKRDIPYSTIIQAFQTLARQILTEPEDQLATWKKRIQAALGNNGRLITDVIPEVELIVGEQPSIPELGPAESQNRFNLVFQNFINVFAQKEHPLTVFLDDMQWADSATLNLIQTVITGSSIKYLCFILAYRNNEIDIVHPFNLMREKVRQYGAITSEIILTPLNLVYVNQLIADTLHSSVEQVEPLAQLIIQKTDGNPFFINEFLKTLHQENLLNFNRQHRVWQWNLAEIEAQGITDNIVSLMIGRMQKLPLATQQVLKLASCIGNRFDLEVLAIVGEQSIEETANALSEAILRGLIISIESDETAQKNSRFRFYHDRVQQAAYALIADESKSAVHLKIGRLLLNNASHEQVNEQIFNLVNQLNLAVDLIIEQIEKDELVRLNLIAGKKAKTSTAYITAKKFFSVAMNLLAENAWIEQYEQTFTLFREGAECEFLTGNLEQAEELFELLLLKAESHVEKSNIYILQIRLYQVAGRYEEALTLGLAALKLFGVTFPDSNEQVQSAIAIEKNQVLINLGDRQVSDLINAPVISDPNIKTLISLLTTLGPPSYLGKPDIFPLVVLKAVNYSLKFGNTEDSCFAYSMYAMLLVSIFRDIPTGYAFSEMTIQLNEKLHDLKLRGVILHIHGSHINVWCNHMATDIPFLERGFIGCVEAGDVTMANYNGYQASWQIIQLGSRLADTYKSLEKYTAFARQSKHEAVYETIRLQQMLLMNLRGLTHQNLTLSDDNFDESRALSIITDAGFVSGIIFYHIIKLIIFFTYRQYAEALNSALKLSQLPVTTLALPIETDYVLYYSLTLTALYPTVSDQEQEQFLQTLELHQQQLQYWANHCAANFLHKSQLVAAEIAGIQGRDLEAMRLYEQSIASAREQGFVQYEALANELGAKFYLKREFELIAKTYLQAAKNAYMRWEAIAKVKHLEECYPQLLPQQQHISNGTFITTGEHLDFLSVVKASQTISSEIVFSRLLKTLMQIVIEQAGAEIGYLLLEHDENLVIEVEAKVNPQVEKLNVSRPRLKGEISQVIPQSILNYVQRTQETVILQNATEQNLFSKDEYVIQKQPKSVLCLPITRQSKLLGILYLENNLISSTFTQDKLSVLEILTVQIAISLENARLYQGLEDSQAQLNLALKSAQIGVWSWDIPNDQFYWDEQTYQLFGLTPETFVGTSEALLNRLHPDDRGLLAQSLSRAINEGVEHNLEYQIIRDDGTIRYLSCRGKAFFNEAGKATHMSGIVLDITDRKQSEAERIQLIQEQTARQEAEADQQRAEFLVKISATLASSLNYESTLASVANLVVPYFADWCSVDLLQENQSIHRVAVAHRDPEKVKLAWELHQRYPKDLDAGEGVPKVLRTGQAEMVAEISDAVLAAAMSTTGFANADPEHLRIMREIGLKSCIIFPLKARERIFGVISFVTAESERRYSTADLSLAEDIAHRAAIAIDNARLYQEAQQAQKTAEIALERIARLQSITAALSESLTPAQVSEVIVEQSMAALGASSALVALVNESKTELEIVRAVGYSPDLVDAWRNFPIDSPSPLAEAVRTGKPIWAQPIQNRVARYPHLAQMYAQYDFEAWISIPLMVEGWAVGGISLGFAHFQELNGEDQAFILAVAQQCAQAIARAHLYEAERTARNAAESANRIKDEFLAVLSHELRTPLNPILGWAKLMRSRKLDQATSDRALETIERNAKLQTQLIEDLLDVSRILQGKLNLNFEPINLVSVIEAAIETVRLSAQAKSIQIQIILESGVGQILGDANRLQQVIWNILSNAIKFTPTGGEVKIKLEQVDSQVQICVTDTGKGIVPEFLHYVFDYFRQADGATTRKFGGLGLGLAIVRHLVELHGGTVQAESLGEGKGATFTVKLPCLEDESKEIKDEKDNSSLVATQFLPLSGLEILVVDDDADMREFLPFMLEQYGASVTVAASAIEALTALSQSQLNLIISDIGMPEMDGYMLMRQVRSLEPEQGGTIPAIALTAYAGEMDYQQAIAVGFQLHISKPVDPEELVKAIVLLDL